MRVSKEPLFKVADKDVHGSVRDLTAIFKHDDNVFVVFFINHGGQQCFSPGYDKKEVLDFFRIKEKEFNEKLAREEGYKLSIFGNFIQKALMKAFPDQLCNLYVIFARRPLD